MARKYFTAEQIISKLREAEVLIGQGKTAAEASRALNISEQTDYRWRKEYGGLGTEQAHRWKELEKRERSVETIGGGSLVGQCDSERDGQGELLSRDRRRQAVQEAQEVFQVSERRVCRALGPPRSTQRYRSRKPNDEDSLTLRMVELSSQYGRYGYRRITALLQNEGWQVNPKRVERLWGQEGLKVPAQQPKRGRLWLNDGSCLRLKPEFPNHVWSYDFMLERTHEGRAFRILNVIDEYMRECLAVKVKRHLDHEDVQECLTELFCSQGVPVPLRSDNGPEFIAAALREWLNNLSVKPLFIEPGSPWENGYLESFNGKMRDELLNREIFFTLQEAPILIERWRKDYNHIHPHSSLGYRSPAPQAWLLAPFRSSG